MISIRATVDENGEVHLREKIALNGPCEAIVTIIDDERAVLFGETALLSEAALAEDWDSPEEDEAWRHLQSAASLC